MARNELAQWVIWVLPSVLVILLLGVSLYLQVRVYGDLRRRVRRLEFLTHQGIGVKIIPAEGETLHVALPCVYLTEAEVGDALDDRVPRIVIRSMEG